MDIGTGGTGSIYPVVVVVIQVVVVVRQKHFFREITTPNFQNFSVECPLSANIMEFISNDAIKIYF